MNNILPNFVEKQIDTLWKVHIRLFLITSETARKQGRFWFKMSGKTVKYIMTRRLKYFGWYSRLGVKRFEFKPLMQHYCPQPWASHLLSWGFGCKVEMIITFLPTLHGWYKKQISNGYVWAFKIVEGLKIELIIIIKHNFPLTSSRLFPSLHLSFSFR